MHLYIVLGNHVLLVEIVHLFTQVYRARIVIVTTLLGYNYLGAVDEWDDDVDTGLQRGVVLAEALDDAGFRLRDDYYSHLDKYDGEGQQGRQCD